MPITVKWIDSLNELRLYYDNGIYWPISLAKYNRDEIESLKKFLEVEDATSH